MHSALLIMAALSGVGLIYFILVRRTFDFVSAGFIGQLIYFSPGFYGYLGNPYYPGVLPSVPIANATYGVWNLCLAATILTGLIYRPERESGAPLVTPLAFDLALVAAIIFSGILSFSTGTGVLSTDKHEVLDNVNRFFLLFASCSQVGVVAFAIQRKWHFLGIAGVAMLFLLYAGFRGEFAISIIAIATYIAHRHRVFIFLKLRYLIPALLSFALLLAYKPFLTAYRIGNWQVLNQLQMSDNLVDTLTLQFEPFLTQAVLNEVLVRNFEVATSSLYFALVALVPFLAPTLGLRPEDVAFNFQDYLFPNLPYGVTASPQTQMIASAGYVGLFFYIFVFNVLLVLCSRKLNARSPYWRLFFLTVGAFLAFYIQRNDLANSFTIINRIGLAILVCWIGNWFIIAGSTRGEGDGRSKVAAG